jgi:hypothetical protein
MNSANNTAFAVNSARDNRVSRHALISCTLLIFAALIDDLAWGQPKFLVVFVLAWSTLRLIVLSRSLADPAVLTAVFAALYCSVPLLAAQPFSQETFYLPTVGAAWIYVVGTAGLLLGISIGYRTISPLPRESSRDGLMDWSGGLACALSLTLSLVFALRYGLVGSDFSYAESFIVRAQSGVGLLMLSVPLAGAAICCTLASGGRLNFWRLSICLLPYVLLYAVHGQRKYLIFPFIFFAAAKLQVRSVRRLLVLLVIGGAGFYFFQFLGFSRTLDYSFEQAASERAISRETLWAGRLSQYLPQPPPPTKDHSHLCPLLGTTC